MNIIIEGYITAEQLSKAGPRMQMPDDGYNHRTVTNW